MIRNHEAFIKKSQACTPGTMMHVMGNEKLNNRVQTGSQILKEKVKDTIHFGTAVASTGIAASTITGLSANATNTFNSAKKQVGQVLNNVLIKTKVNNKSTMKSVKKFITESGVYKKFSKLTVPAQVGILVATATAALFTPFFTNASSAKAGYIEGQNETK